MVELLRRPIFAVGLSAWLLLSCSSSDTDRPRGTWSSPVDLPAEVAKVTQISCVEGESVCVGTAQTTTSTGAIIRSVDAGETWAVNFVPPNALDTVGVQCVPGGKCAFSTFSPASEHLVFYSSDAGATWTQSRVGDEGFIGRMSCSRQPYCLATGEIAGEETLWTSVDLVSWHEMDARPWDGSFSDVWCIDAERCLVIGESASSRVVAVSDEEGSWRGAITLGRFPNTISCTSDGQCMAGGVGALLTSRGDLSNWVPLLEADQVTSVSAVACFATKDCVAAMDDQLISSGRPTEPDELPAGLVDVYALWCGDVACVAIGGDRDLQSSRYATR